MLCSNVSQLWNRITVRKLLEELLPKNVHKLIHDGKRDKIKFNNLPTKLNPVDSCLKLCASASPDKHRLNFHKVHRKNFCSVTKVRLNEGSADSESCQGLFQTDFGHATEIFQYTESDKKRCARGSLKAR